MADASLPFDPRAPGGRSPSPRTWGEALSAMPLETPPLAVWTQIAARLEQTPSDAQTPTETDASSTLAADARCDLAAAAAIAARRRRIVLALAASLCALALLPLLRTTGDGGRTIARAPASSAAETQAPSPRTSIAPAPAVATDAESPIETAPRTEIASIADSPNTIKPKFGAPGRGNSKPSGIAPEIGNASRRVPPHRSPIAKSPFVVATIRIENPGDRGRQTVEASIETSRDTPSSAMEPLYAASARLESLLANTRAPRAETGPAAALSNELESQIATIDAQLSTPGLSNREQYALWQARIGTLRQAVAFESEQSALAAEGRSYEGKLVDVY